ncbi:MAG TPA: ATP-binding cassette domain-containing protein [Chthoniobacterales bacterium]|nr:ATP-binding cassette domain-containing protein [Chthoniobacterales bacterium]
MTALSCSRLRCHRPNWTDRPACVHDVSLSFEEGLVHGITGPPGSGKTLLSHLLGLLDEPDFGSIDLFGEKVSPASEEERRAIRNSVFGYVFPSSCLLPAFTVAENVAMPLFRISGADENAAQERVSELLYLLGIEHLANDRAGSLGTDAQFLAALARALVHRPRILLLLAPQRPVVLMPHIRSIAHDLHITCLWSGAPDQWLAICDHTVKLENGSIATESPALP